MNGTTFAAERAEGAREQRRGRHAVDVVVAVHEDRLAVANGAHEPLDGAAQVEKLFRRAAAGRAAVAGSASPMSAGAWPRSASRRQIGSGSISSSHRLRTTAGSGASGKDPASARARGGGGRGHPLKLGADAQRGTTVRPSSFRRVQQRAASLAHLEGPGGRHRGAPLGRDRRVTRAARRAAERENRLGAATRADVIVLARASIAARPGRSGRAWPDRLAICASISARSVSSAARASA